jgi:hypothetical protein
VTAALLVALVVAGLAVWSRLDARLGQLTARRARDDHGPHYPPRRSNYHPGTDD